MKKKWNLIKGQNKNIKSVKTSKQQIFDPSCRRVKIAFIMAREEIM